jgi:hypothetical protein
MDLTIQCPHCSQEFVVGNIRPDTVAVCPKCFQLIPLSPSTTPSPTPQSGDAWEVLCQEILAPAPSEHTESPPPTPSPPSSPPGAAASPPTATPQPHPHHTTRSADSSPAEKLQNDTWKATILGCIVPLAMLLATALFLVWYITSRSDTTSP